MVSITCPRSECAHNGRGHKCTAKAINFTYRNMATMNEGRVDMLVCDKYELSESAKRVEQFFDEFFGYMTGRTVKRNDTYVYLS